MDQIDLPKGTILNGLETVYVVAGTWNKGRIWELLSWLAPSAPNLKTFCIKDQTKETANLFFDGLTQNDVFLDKFKDNLECLGIGSCNLIEEDAIFVIFNIRPLYPGLAFFFCMTTIFEVYKISERQRKN
jgi:hypothetical protein